MPTPARWAWGPRRSACWAAVKAWRIDGRAGVGVAGVALRLVEAAHRPDLRRAAALGPRSRGPATRAALHPGLDRRGPGRRAAHPGALPARGPVLQHPDRAESAPVGDPRPFRDRIGLPHHASRAHRPPGLDRCGTPGVASAAGRDAPPAGPGPAAGGLAPVPARWPGRGTAHRAWLPER